MIILDTNVVSELMNPRCDPIVRRWIDSVERSMVHSTAVTSYEIEFSIARLPAGKRKETLIASWREVLEVFLVDRILSFDHAAGLKAGELKQIALEAGNNCDICDILIAGIACSRDAAVASRNLVHISGLPVRVINPWSTA